MFQKLLIFLDKIKSMGYTASLLKEGLSFSLGDIIIPDQKKLNMIDEANGSSRWSIIGNYNMGLITNNERYNQVIDVWTSTNAKVD